MNLSVVDLIAVVFTFSLVYFIVWIVHPGRSKTDDLQQYSADVFGHIFNNMALGVGVLVGVLKFVEREYFYVGFILFICLPIYFLLNDKYGVAWNEIGKSEETE